MTAAEGGATGISGRVRAPHEYSSAAEMGPSDIILESDIKPDMIKF